MFLLLLLLLLLLRLLLVQTQTPTRTQLEAKVLHWHVTSITLRAAAFIPVRAGPY